MSETMSSPGDWGQFYQQSLSNQVAPLGRTLSGTVFGGERVSEATVVTTTIPSATAPTTLLGSANPGPSGGASGLLSPEGRVSKPVRRRSRASRRTPTTLLNTDTTNFRAMVQQFTGGPSAPYAAGSQLNATNFSFGLGLRQANVNPATTTPPFMVSPAAAAAGYHLQYQTQQQQQQQQQYQHQNQPRPGSYMFSLGNNNSSFGTSGGHDFFLQRLGNINPSPARPAPTSMEEAVSSDRFLMEGVSAQGPPPPPPPPSSRSFLQ